MNTLQQKREQLAKAERNVTYALESAEVHRRHAAALTREIAELEKSERWKPDYGDHAHYIFTDGSVCSGRWYGKQEDEDIYITLSTSSAHAKKPRRKPSEIE